jgi:hypothetical protein
VYFVCHINGIAYVEVFENRILMKVFGLKGEEITLRGGKKCRMRSIMIFTGNQIFASLRRRNELGGACDAYGGGGGEKPEGKRVRGRLKCMWKDSIKMESKRSAGSA